VFVHGSRYAQVPILLLYSVVFVTLDAFLSRSSIRFERPVRLRRAAPGIALLLVVLVAFTALWATDFRYVNRRATSTTWAVLVRDGQRTCEKRLPPRVLARRLPKNLTCSMLDR